MKEWLTAQEIADAGLPSLPTTKRGVNELAEREGWNADEVRARRRAGRGGGMEYAISRLPTLAQVAYKQRHLRVGSLIMPAAANDAPTLAGSGAVCGKAALERDARLAILRAFDLFARGQRLNKTATEHLFLSKYQAGTLYVEAWVRECVPSVSKRSLARWREAAAADRNKLAIDKSANRKGKSVLDLAHDGQVRVFMLALLADNQHLSALHIQKLCRSQFGDTLIVGSKSVPMPPVRTFQHALKVLRTTEKVVLTKIQNPDLFRSTMAPAGRGVLRDVVEANALWMIDASPIDALCTDGRHTIYVCIDIATRRIVLLVSKTPRASAVALMLRKAILAFGAPVAVKTDNGSDFVAKSVQRLFAHLDIEAIRSNAYSPQEKGHVERVIRTFQHDCATTLPGFVGHSVADRKAIEARKSFAARLGEADAQAFGVELSGADLQDAADRWADLVYHQRSHEGLGRRSPDLAAAQSTTTIRTVKERALDVLLMPIAGGGTRRTTRFGIRADGRHYMTPSILPGTEVFVRMDPADMGLVYAFTPDGEEFLGVGICPELSGIHPETAVQAIKAAQREIVERGTASIKAEIRKLKSGPSYFERIIAVAAADAPNVVALPKRTEAHTTPQIAAALDVTVSRATGARPVDPSVSAEQQKLIAEMAAEDDAAVRAVAEAKTREREAEIERDRVAHLPPKVVALPESAKYRYRRAVLLERAIAAGEPVAATDAILLERYRQTSEFRGERDMHDAYGDEYLAL